MGQRISEFLTISWRCKVQRYNTDTGDRGGDCELAAELWGLTEEELREIQESLEELG